MDSSNKAKQKSKIKKRLLLLFCFITLVIIAAICIYRYAYITNFDELEDFYFIRYYEDFNTKEGNSVIYHYDAREDSVSEVGSVSGKLPSGALNDSGTHIIGVLDGDMYIRYDLDKCEIVQQISKSELVERLGLEEDYKIYSRDFAPSGESIYMVISNGEDNILYLYNFNKDTLEMITEIEEPYSFEVAENIICYSDGENISSYNLETGECKALISIESKWSGYKLSGCELSRDGKKLLLTDSADPFETTFRLFEKIYVYDIETDTIKEMESGYYISDMCWNRDYYIYVEKYYGFIVDANPTIKVSNGFWGPDKVIYRVEGLLKGGHLYLIENP